MAEKEQKFLSDGGGEGGTLFSSFRPNLGFTHVSPAWANGNGNDCCAGQLDLRFQADIGLIPNGTAGGSKL